MFNRIGALFGGSAGRAEADPRLETFADARLQTDVTVMLGVADRAAADLQSGTDDPCRDRMIRRVEVLEAPRLSTERRLGRAVDRGLDDGPVWHVVPLHSGVHGRR